MMKNNNPIITLKRAVLFCLCVSLSVLSACQKSEKAGVKTIKSVSSVNVITNPCKNVKTHYSENRGVFSEKVAASGLIELYVDREKNSFCILETSKNHVWSALPLLDESVRGEKPTGDASMAEIKVVGGTDSYLLNSQDNSLAYGKASYKKIKNGAAFIFDIFPDEKTAAKQKYEKTDIGFRICISVRLIDGNMFAHCSRENLTGNPDAYIESLELLNRFGAYRDSLKDDFLLVPDGCGAIIKTAIYDESFEDLSFSVYGDDPSVPDGRPSSGNAVVPAFGIRRGESAFVALVQNGAAATSVKAQKAAGAGEYNAVYPSFKITPALYKDKTLYISKAPVANEISLCYRFLSGNNATYAELAAACREQLIRNSVLSSKKAAAENYAPFYLTLTGAAPETFGPLRYLKPLTTFDQARDMLVRMKNKGINNVRLRYSGIFSGGTDSKNINSARVLLRLGGAKKLRELYDYMSAQKMRLLLDVDQLSSSTGFAGREEASNILKKNASYVRGDPLIKYLGEEFSPRRLRRVEKLNGTVSVLLGYGERYGFSGFCLDDAGSLLYSDFSPGGLMRDAAADFIGAVVSPLSTDYDFTTVKGNFYMLKNADAIINMPLESSVPKSGAYCPVPFIQLILHGIVDYSGEPINARLNLRETALKYVEYGACPHFQWNYGPVSEKTESDLYYYDNTINAAAEFYAEANEALNDLRGARMTDHCEVDDGVFRVEYDSGSIIYVNYTSEEYFTLGTVVPARSFLRIN